MHLLEHTPADTLNYMIAGYSLILGLMFIYVLSLYLRWCRLRQEWDIQQELEEKGE